jgi:CDP-diacylglycerol---glycerol-3-phosphate 3-phosphatidyltransferase
VEGRGLATPTYAAPPLMMPSNPGATESRLLLGVPNRITLLRTLVAMGIASWAFHAGGWSWLVAGYLVYWAGDIIDGIVARARHEETVIGAVLDVVCDRACAFVLAGAFMVSYPEVIGPLSFYLIQFGVLDMMLTLAFLLWPGVISPNYFYLADRWIWLWNWSKPAKGLNSTAVIVALALGLSYDALWLPYLVAGVATVVKFASTVRLVRILSGRTVAVPAR